MKILVVEDDTDKLREISQTLIATKVISTTDIDTASNVAGAKRLLAQTKYDILILDISLPYTVDAPAAPDAAMSLLDELHERAEDYLTPGYVVGITAYADLIEPAAERFADDLWCVLEYDRTNVLWQRRLSRIVDHIRKQAHATEAADAFETDVCIVTALFKPELEAVLRLPWSWSVKEFAADPTAYHSGVIMKSRPWSVVAAHAPEMGMPAAATLATKMILRFKPRFVAMVGITAGVRGECELGDVIAADPSWDWGSGKMAVSGGSPVFQPDPRQVRMSSSIRNKITRLAANRARLDEISRGFLGDIAHTSDLNVRVGPVASGASVLQDRSYTQFIQSQQRKLLGVEMETYAVYTAAYEARTPEAKPFALKGVCDFADEHKNDAYQAYAAYASAGVLRVLIEEYM